MRAVVVVVVATVLTGGLAGAAQTPPKPTGEWVARQVENRDTGRDARVAMQMRLFDRQGRVRERTLELTSLRGAAGAGDRVLLRFTAPSDIRGTSFLVLEQPGPAVVGEAQRSRAEDERFLYLPALGRVRRIAGAEAQESFAGSDLTYEEIGGRALDDYRYTLLPDADPQVYRLESVSVDARAKYPRIVSRVRKDNFVVTEAEIYNRRNERQKIYRVRRLERVSGVWTAMDVAMANELEHTRTELVVTKAEYNVGLKESDFSRRELERAGAGLGPPRGR